MNLALSSVRYEWLSIQYLFFIIFFHVEENGILVEYGYSILRIIFNTAQLDFITAHSNFITAQMGSVTPLI